MTLITGLLGLFAGTTLAAGALATYYRWRWGQTETALKRILDIGAEWRTFNTALRDRAEKAERALHERLQKESADDATTRSTLEGDAAAAARALNQLHEDSARAHPGSGDAMSFTDDPGVPGDNSGPVRQ